MTSLKTQALAAPGPDTHITELATRINSRVKMAETHARKALECALEIGALLIEAKALVPHGGWNDWITHNCVLASRTARSYVQLATVYPSLPEPERQRVAALPVREAVRAIATDPMAPARAASEAPTCLPRDSQERNRLIKKFRATAGRLREATKFFDCGLDLKGAKVSVLRRALTDAIAELDRLQEKPEEAQ